MICDVSQVDDAAVQRRLAALAVEHGPISLLELAIFEVLVPFAEYPDLHGYLASQSRGPSQKTCLKDKGSR